jgi:hypothetical protein
MVATGIDQIINGPDGPYQTYKPPAGETLEQATDSFDLSVLRQQPLAIPLSVARDAIRLFALTKDGTANITPISRWQFQTTYAFYPPGVTYQVVADAGKAYGGGAPVAVGPLATFLRDYQLDGGYTPGPLLAAMTATGALGSLFLLRRRRRGSRGRAATDDRQLALASALVTVSAVVLLAGSDFYEFTWRYQLPALVLLPLAGALGYTVIAKRLRHHLPVRRSGRPGTRRRQLAVGPFTEPEASLAVPGGQLPAGPFTEPEASPAGPDGPFRAPGALDKLEAGQSQ